MVNLQKINTLLGDLSLPHDVEAEVRSAVQVLGEKSLSQLQDWLELNRLVDKGEQKYYLEWLDFAGRAMRMVVQKNDGALAELFAGVRASTFEGGRLCLPVAYDVYSVIIHDTKAWSNTIESLCVFLLNQFRFLSVEAIGWMVTNYIVRAIRYDSSVLANFRLVYYVAEPQYDGGEWGRQFVPLIEHNQEQLGEKIVIGGSSVAPTVERWLQEYNLFSGKPGPQRGALDRLKFVEESPNGKALSKEDKQVLLKLCELYDWFTDPFVTEAELAEFEDITPGEQRPGLVHTNDVVQEEDVEEEPEEIEVDVTRPNVQGVLVQTPLGVSPRSGLEVAGDTAAPLVEAPAPTLDMPAKPEPSPLVLPKQAPPVLNMDKVRQDADAKKKAMQAEIDAKLEKLRARN